MPTVNGVAYEIRCSSAVLCMPPGGYDIRIWSNAATLMSDRLTCVLVDGRGSGRSPRTPERDDRVADVRAVLDDAGVRDCTIVAVGNSADVALTIAQEEPGLISAVVLINPTLREYLDPRLPSYLGALIEAERNRSLQTVTQAGSPPKAADLAERLVPTTADDEHRTLLRNQVEDILTSAFEHARQPQQHVPLLVLERLHKLHNIPIRLITVGEGSTADGAEKVIVEALKHALANADHVHVRSSWGNLLPLGEPIPVAKLIEEVAVKTTSKP